MVARRELVAPSIMLGADMMLVGDQRAVFRKVARVAVPDIRQSRCSLLPLMNSPSKPDAPHSEQRVEWRRAKHVVLPYHHQRSGRPGTAFKGRRRSIIAADRHAEGAAGVLLHIAKGSST